MRAYEPQAPGPWRSNEERLVTEALQVALVPGDVIARMHSASTRPLFPPRFGYRQAAIGIDDVIRIDRVYPGSGSKADDRSDFSGGPGAINASSRNVQGTW